MRVIFYPIAIIIVSFVAFRQSIFSDYFIIGGEANYFIDFNNYIEIFKYPWMFKWGMGYFNPLISGTGINVQILAILESLIHNDLIINHILFYLLFTLPALSMYIFLNYLKIDKLPNFLISIFYIYNPFSIDYLHQFNQWSNTSLIFIPLMFLILTIKYKNYLTLFLTTLIFFNLISFSFANPPTFIIYIIAIFVYLFFLSFKNKKFNYGFFLTTFFLSLLSIFISNFYWIYNLIISLNTSTFISSNYSQSFASDYLYSILKDGGPAMSKLFSFLHLGSDTPSNSTAYSIIFKSIYFKISMTFLFFIVIFINLFSKNIQSIQFAFLTVFFLFMSKGLYQPLSTLYLSLYKYLPLFSVFKTPQEKFGILYLIFFTISIAFFSRNIKIKYFYLIVLPIVFTLLYIPMTKGVITHYAMTQSNGVTTSVDRLIKLDDEFFESIEVINNLNNDKKVITLPGNYNYQIFVSFDERIYSGLDPFINNTNKDYVDFSQTVFNPYIRELYESFESNIGLDDTYKFNIIKKLLVKNINYIILYKNVKNIFGFYNDSLSIEYFQRQFEEELYYENKHMLIYNISKHGSSKKPIFIKDNNLIEYLF